MRWSRVIRRLKTNFLGWLEAHAEGSRFAAERDALHHLQLTSEYLMSILHSQRTPRTALEACAKTVFSQTDEDGITLEIVRRIGLHDKTCLEIGSGNGLENNTLVLLAIGWNAIWVDGLDLAFDAQVNPQRLVHSRSFVTRENVCELVSKLSENNKKPIEYISVDVDGNDGYLTEELLQNGFRPSVFVVEINEVFPPPIVFRQNYVKDHVWDRTRNYGWSLQAFIDLFNQYEYQLVACNPQTGVNAFFIRQDHMSQFTDIPSDPIDLFVGRSIKPYKYRYRELKFDSATIAHLIANLK